MVLLVNMPRVVVVPHWHKSRVSKANISSLWPVLPSQVLAEMQETALQELEESILQRLQHRGRANVPSDPSYLPTTYGHVSVSGRRHKRKRHQACCIVLSLSDRTFLSAELNKFIHDFESDCDFGSDYNFGSY